MDAQDPGIAQYSLRPAAFGGERQGAHSQFATIPGPPGPDEHAMPKITSLTRFQVPLGGQDIELQEVVHDAGGMHLLRVRIREKTRFTIFDVDPLTARRWADAMRRWSDSQPAGVEADGRTGG